LQVHLEDSTHLPRVPYHSAVQQKGPRTGIQSECDQAVHQKPAPGEK